MHLIIYDFHKEVFIESNKNEIKSKIENILSDIKINKSLFIGRDENIPFLSYQDKKDIKIKVKQNNEKVKNNISKNKDLEDEEKSFEKKINDVINKKEVEISIKRLIKFSLILFFIILIFYLINLYFYISIYSSIKKLIKLIKASISMKYVNTMSLYFVRELSLLNFNAHDIVGGEYILFAGKNKTNYTLVMAEKLLEKFNENKRLMKTIFSSDITFRKNTTKYLSEIVLDVYFLIDDNLKVIQSDIFSTIVQYNNAFYNLVSTSIYLNQNNLILNKLNIKYFNYFIYIKIL